MSLRSADKSKPYLPLSGDTNDGHSTPTSATATCFCGAVRLAFVCCPSLLLLPKADHLPKNPSTVTDVHVCNCTDCHKIHSSLFGCNFVIPTSALQHVSGQDELTEYSTSKSVGTGNTMTNYFCKVCGSIMYRIGTGFPGKVIMRVGTVDDFNMMEGLMKPEVEQFVKDRVSWLRGVEGARQVEGFAYA
ncbi:glutathione-dependent formaldehyde-activating enzyme-like protein 2 [Elsinoe australis]|uniref:Glutathione-dependent formaldehyde-activating enzyme-like protein 2 n=1 Tax=Elsinoe australis TaxID=40998 RepID=A0A4U7ASQ9_9PEZI|nr:glutathione-dependent formaldehyde-activating enzyme-like protein 2 [Elsinoe australis]